MQKYHLEFILCVYKTSLQVVKNSLAEFGEGLEINNCEDGDGKGKNLKINIDAEEPTVIFDICSQFGRIKSVKIDERNL